MNKHLSKKVLSKINMKSSQTFLVVGRTFAYTRYLFVSNRITFRDAHSLGLRTGLYMFSRINILLLAGTVSVQQIGNQTMLLIWFNMLWTTNWLWIFKSEIMCAEVFIISSHLLCEQPIISLFNGYIITTYYWGRMII